MYTESLTAAILEAEKLVAAAPHIETEADLLEGLQYLAQGIAACTHVSFHYDRDHPFFLSGTGPFTKMGLDNPDTLYFGTRVQPGHEYVVSGVRGTTTDLSFQLLGGEYTDENVPVSEAAFDDRELDIAADGTFEWRFTPKSPAQLVVREVYSDWSQRRGTIAIERIDTAGTAPPPLTQQTIEKRYATAGKQLVQPHQDVAAVSAVVLPQPAGEHDGCAAADTGRPGDTVLVGGAFRSFARPGAGHHRPAADAPYLGFQLGSLWYISLDYINHQTSLNAAQAQADPDGKIRIVVADRSPGITNWVETLGHRKGFLQFRWQRVSRQLTEADGPTVELVDFDEVPAALPFYESQQDLRRGLAGTDCAAAEADRRQNGGVSHAQGLLEGKVVVISGVGPALGTTLARRCAEDGADLVLAARTVERLDDVAKEIADLGRRAVAVATDITDDAQVKNLVDESLAAYGKVDVLINNAFRVPSMKPLANTTFEHIRDAIELTVLGALRLTQGFTPALAEAERLRRERQLDGDPALAGQVRRLQDGQVGAAGDVAVAGHRTRRAGHPGELRCAGLYLGRHAEELLQPSGRQVRHHRRADLRRDGG